MSVGRSRYSVKKASGGREPNRTDFGYRVPGTVLTYP